MEVIGNQKRLEKAFNDYFRIEVLQSYEGNSYSIQEEGYVRKEIRVVLVNEVLSVLGDIPAEDISIRYYMTFKERYVKKLFE